MHRRRLRSVLPALRKVSEATGVSVARVALAWQLTKPFVTSIIIGAKNKVAELLGAPPPLGAPPRHVEVRIPGKNAILRRDEARLLMRQWW